METQTQKAEISYPDPSGYDCEGYGLSTGLHKRLGVRRGFRPGFDDPITDAERRLGTDEERKVAGKNARQAKCGRTYGHEFEVLSHEENRCVRCGYLQFVLDD